MPKVLISIILYKSDLDFLIKSFKIIEQNQEDLIFSIIDNDNGSKIAEMQELLRDNFNSTFQSKFSFIASENVGFGAGHNKSFIQNNNKEFDYFLCVNPDGILHPNCIKELILFAKKHSNKGIFEAMQFPIEHAKDYDPQTYETNWCSGACIMFPRKVFQELKGFDEDFFMYMEDVDLSWRARAEGYKCYIVENAIFMHDVLSENRNPAQIKKSMLKSGIIMAKKYKNKSFGAFCRHTLSVMMNDKIELSLYFDNIERSIKEIDNLKKYEGIVDFQYLFNFSAMRWLRI